MVLIPAREKATTQELAKAQINVSMQSAFLQVPEPNFVFMAKAA